MFGIWIKNPIMSSRYGHFALDINTESSVPIYPYTIRTMTLAQVFPMSTAYVPELKEDLPRV